MPRVAIIGGGISGLTLAYRLRQYLADVDVQILDAGGAVVASTVTNDNGEYFITLKGDVVYTIKVVKKGYKTAEEKVELKIGKTDTFSLEKQILLNKDK